MSKMYIHMYALCNICKHLPRARRDGSLVGMQRYVRAVLFSAEFDHEEEEDHVL